MTPAKARAYQGVSGYFSVNQSIITSRFKARTQVLKRCIDLMEIDRENTIFLRADLCGHLLRDLAVNHKARDVILAKKPSSAWLWVAAPNARERVSRHVLADDVTKVIGNLTQHPSGVAPIGRASSRIHAESQ
jgi:hypothetical protein